MFVIKSNEMKKLEQYMIETVGVSGLILMENAARAVVDVVMQRYSLSVDLKPIVVLCGAGNNGGDGLCIARWLVHKGYKVHVVVFGEEERFTYEAAIQLKIMEQMTLKYEHLSVQKINVSAYDLNKEDIFKLIQCSGLLIDSLIGTGCTRTLSSQLSEVVSYMNEQNTPIIAVDVPTGINSDNGKVMGTAVCATITVTFCLPKLGHVLFPGASYCGELIVADIGIFESALHNLERPISLIDRALYNDYAHNGFFERERFSHKGTFGTLGIIAGDRHMLGASILAARAAYKTGVGLVKIFVEEAYAQLFISSIPECIVVTYDSETTKEVLEAAFEEFALHVNSILIGPGLSKSIKSKHFVQHILMIPQRVIMDADALNILSDQIELLDERQCDLIITPHIGEMSRLTGYCSEGILENLLPFAEAFSEQHRITTVLKSARTVIVSKDLNRYINMLGNSGMATAGSGDVLAGIIAGFVAQGYSDEHSAVVGTLLHSLAGDAFAQKNNEQLLTASDLINNLWQDGR